MERHNYPALRQRPDFIYLDASNGFPLHDHVTQRVTTLAGQYVGMPGKGAYSDTMAINALVEETRQKAAELIGAHPSEITFVSSATEAARLVAEQWCVNNPDAIVAYSMEDHTATVNALASVPHERTHLLSYNEAGEYYGETGDATVFFLNHLHHMYGTDIATNKFRETNPQAKLVIDASQSVSRMVVDVQRLSADALYFSGHKLGVLPGVGVLYVAKKHRSEFDIQDNCGASLSWLGVASIGAAIDVLLQKSMSERSMYMTGLTNYLVEQLEEIPDVAFSKGAVGALDVCDGNGIVSFKLRGFTAADIMMLLDEHSIAVRGGDHCVSPEHADRDYVRVSMQGYTTHDDIDRLIEVLKGIR